MRPMQDVGDRLPQLTTPQAHAQLLRPMPLPKLVQFLARLGWQTFHAGPCLLACLLASA